MTASNIDSLIKKALLNHASKEDLRKLEEWLNASDINQEVFDQMKIAWDEVEPPGKAINEEEIIDNIWSLSEDNLGESHTSNFKQRWMVVLKIAVAVSLILAFYFTLRIDPNPKQIVENQIQHIEKKNISGQKSKIHLSDGTVVWLNAESTLSYTKPFKKELREVELMGEAYFEVAKDVQRPFIVNLQNTKVKVLGTAFNVSSSGEDNKNVISLAEGKILITHGSVSQILTAGWIAEIDKRTNHLESFEGNVMDNIAWTKDILLFNNASYDEIFERIRRWYGIELHIVGQPDNAMKFNGSFQHEYLENVLENLKIENKIDYKFDGEKVYINFN